MRRGEQVAAADHMGDALRGVVERDGEVIGGGGRPCARGPRRRGTAGRRGRCRRRRRATSIPPRAWGGIAERWPCRAASNAACPGPALRAPGTSPDTPPPRAHAARSCWRRCRRGCRSRGRAGPCHATGRAPPGRAAALRLEHRFAVPAEPEPFEVRQDRVDMGPAAAGAVDILDPQQEAPAKRTCVRVRLHRRPGVAEVEPPGGAGRESRDDHRETRT